MELLAAVMLLATCAPAGGSHGLHYYVGGAWTTGAGGTLVPPQAFAATDSMAFTEHALGDFNASVEFAWGSGWTGAALAFGQDSERFFALDFPAVGQQCRAEHLWSVPWAVEGGHGWRRGLQWSRQGAAEIVHGVTSAVGVWHTLNVSVQHGEVSATLDGRPLSTAMAWGRTGSAGYRGGRVGLVTYDGDSGTAGKSQFRNLHIQGTPTPTQPAWSSPKPKEPFSVVANASGGGCGNAVLLDSGEIMLQVGVGGGHAGDPKAKASVPHMARSHDNGKTFVIDPTPVSSNLAPTNPTVPGVSTDMLIPSADGKRLLAFGVNSTHPFTISRAESDDDGVTWSEPVAIGEVVLPFNETFVNLYAGCATIRTASGTILISGYARTEATPAMVPQVNASGLLPDGRMAMDQRSTGMNVILRSNDPDGHSFTAVDADGPPYNVHGGWMVEKEASETAVAQAKDGRVIAITRSFMSPFVWETSSDSDGAVFTPLARGPFFIAASCNSFVSTRAGVLLIGGRFPGIGVQVSWNNGMTWHVHQIDIAIWCNGAMVETAEDNVVLYVYGGLDQPQSLRYQRIRVHPRPCAGGEQPGGERPCGITHADL